MEPGCFWCVVPAAQKHRWVGRDLIRKNRGWYQLRVCPSRPIIDESEPHDFPSWKILPAVRYPLRRRPRAG